MLLRILTQSFTRIMRITSDFVTDIFEEAYAVIEEIYENYFDYPNFKIEMNFVNPEINFVNVNYYDDSNVMIIQMQWHP